MTQLLLVRHGEPLAATAEPGGADEPGAGADPALSERGHAQAARFADWLSGIPEAGDVVEVVTSTMRRARETAAPVVSALGTAPPAAVEDLCEFDRGRPTYTPVAQRDDADEEWQRIRQGLFPTFVDGPGFTERVVGALDDVAARHSARRSGRASVLVVCHAGVINTYLAALLGLERPLTFPLHHVSVSRVLVSRSGTRRVSSVNETQHVADLL